MRERVTYVQKGFLDFNPKNIDITQTSLAITGLDAIKEQQITFSQPEIPADIWRVLRNCHELHIRWSSAQPHDLVAPFVSRVAPGLHVSFTPLEGRSGKRICSLLKETFDPKLKCDSVEEAFTSPQPLSGRFASGASKQYYYFLHSLRDLSLYIQRTICGGDGIPCRIRATDLERAQSFDLDYDALSQSLVLKALWTKPNGDDDRWHETHYIGKSPTDTLEIGILTNEDPTDPEELKYSGFLTQIGKATKPSSTLFSFPSRHHPLPPTPPLSFRTTFDTPTGLHPTLHLTFLTPPSPPNPSCKLHAYFTLPSYIFIDRYPFSDPLFLSTHNLKALHSLTGATDLEAPDWTVSEWGSAALLELATPPETSSTSSKRNYQVSIPLHLRYLTPLNASHVLTPIPYPSIFYACPSDNSGTKFASSPFDRVNLGYDDLFGTNTLFYHVPPTTEQRSVEYLSVPVLDLQDAKWVEFGTLVAVLAGTVWILGVLGWGILRGSGKVDGSGKAKAKKGGLKKRE